MGFDRRELQEAGLIRQGMYKWNVAHAEAVHLQGISQRTGDPYDFKIIKARLESDTVAEYSDSGELVGEKQLPFSVSKFHDFNAGRDNRLKTLYKSAYGKLPEGREVEVKDEEGTPVKDPKTGQVKTIQEIDEELLADELIGASAWNAIYHAPNKETGDLEDRLGYNFREKPPKRNKRKAA